VFHTATISKRDRKTIYKFDGPVLESTPEDGEEVWHERVKLVCMHNADNKAYEAHVTWCKASERNGFQIEQSAIFTDPYVFVCLEYTGRYSANKFEAFCMHAQRECIDIVNDEYNISVAAELLRKAQGFSVAAV
jgi:hypothetical protein